MRKNYTKLLATVIVLVLTSCMVVAVSYAWLSVSNNPAVNGIRVTVGGGRTILLAPDMTETAEDGTVIHYPGAFDAKLVFSQHETYNSLGSFGGLLPVSTADGLHWITPVYYSNSDPEVLSGQVNSGQLKPVSLFETDDSLTCANLSEEELSGADGSYIYLDFWVVSPGSEYKLRVTSGDENGGSFLIGLPYPQESPAGVSGYVLSDAGDSAAASARVGFLVNRETVQDGSMLAYQRSVSYSEQYTRLLGVYQEKGESVATYENLFTIYEPNGTLHTAESGAENGSYVVTSPLQYSYGAVEPTDVSSILTVQKANTWTAAEDGNGIMLDRIFQTALTGKEISSAKQAFSVFYEDYLQGQVAPYVTKGEFFTNTSNLYALATAEGENTLSAQAVKDSMEASGATEDVIITILERNTPQRIRMFIWLEGQDADCTADAALSDFALSIELSGSN